MTTQQKLINMLCVAILKKKHNILQNIRNFTTDKTS